MSLKYICMYIYIAKRILDQNLDMHTSLFTKKKICTR